MGIEILSDLIITDVYSASTSFNSEGTGKKRYNRPHWGIIIKYEGETRYTSGGNTYISNAENIVILPKGVTYEWKCLRTGHFLAVDFESPLTCSEILSFHVPNNEKIIASMKKLEAKMANRGEFTKIESISAVYSIITSLIKTVTKKYLPTSRHQKIAPALEYLSAHYNEKITNDTLAEMCGISTPYFRRLFTEITGQSPIDYLQALRIKKAKEILRGDFGKMSDVSIALGFSSIYDFSRAFKKYEGISPTAFKKTV